MRKPNDLTGRIFGLLTVTRMAEPDSYGKVQWWVRCECGNERSIRASNLTSGSSSSCGCARHGPRPRIRITTLPPKPEVREIVKNLWVDLYEGIPKSGMTLGFAVCGPIFILPRPRPTRHSSVSVTQMRMMSELLKHELIQPQGERNAPRWIREEGVGFKLIFKGDAGTVREEFARMTKRHDIT